MYLSPDHLCDQELHSYMQLPDYSYASVAFQLLYFTLYFFSKLLPCLTKQDANSTKMVVTKLKNVFTKASTIKNFRYTKLGFVEEGLTVAVEHVEKYAITCPVSL